MINSIIKGVCLALIVMLITACSKDDDNNNKPSTTKVELISPTDGSTTDMINIELKWRYTDGNTYTVMASEDGITFVKIAENLNTGNFTINKLPDEGEYRWKVIAQNSKNNNKTESTTWRFIVKKRPMEAPVVLFPKNGANNIDLNMIMSWHYINNAKYNIYLGKTEKDMKKILSNYTETTYEIDDLKANTTYYWKVEGVTENPSKTTVSDLYKFTTTTDEAQQPDPVKPNENLDRVVGFWDFNGSGANSVKNQSNDMYFHNTSMISDGKVTITKDYDKDDNMPHWDMTAKLWDYGFGDSQGLHQRRYFSGAIRFKIKEEKQHYTILTFGNLSRWLKLSVVSKNRLRIEYGNNDKKVANTNITISKNIWHVLYFRYEDFDLSSTPENDENRFHIQLDNQKEVKLNLGDVHLDKLVRKDDVNIGLNDLSSYKAFLVGQVDWIIMASGRMTPSTVQYRVQQLTK